MLDSSALLALLNRERGAEKLTSDVVSVAVCSCVNFTEVLSKLLLQGLNEREAFTAAFYSIAEIADFTLEHARIAGNLIMQTRTLGLSLGDRACLALGMQLGAPIYTADRLWKQLRLPVAIHVIR